MNGALSFIGILLAIAGVERNPGPHKIFVFRYQCLLIQVGTCVLRKVFDHIVGPDFKVYLDNSPFHKAQFQLLSRNVLTPAQLQLLPPIDNTPSSDTFDITLLTCLLRNVCGLCRSSDQVWVNPQPTDQRVEAYIARLKQCRNDFAHSGSVFEDEAVLTAKWNELCSILEGLSNFCGYRKLKQLINLTASAEIDDQKRQNWFNGMILAGSATSGIRKEHPEESTCTSMKRQSNETTADCGGLVCLNGGTLDPTTCKCECKCECPKLYMGESCENFSDMQQCISPKCPLQENERRDILRVHDLPKKYAVDYHKTCSERFHDRDLRCDTNYTIDSEDGVLYECFDDDHCGDISTYSYYKDENIPRGFNDFQNQYLACEVPVGTYTHSVGPGTCSINDYGIQSNATMWNSGSGVHQGCNIM